MEQCPCGSAWPYADCCGPIIAGNRPAATPEQLMRSRYCAYVKKEYRWLRESLHPGYRADFDEKSSRDWADRASWHGIEVLHTERGGPDDDAGRVEFVVTYTENGVRQEHHEQSSFRKEGGAWYFTEGKPLPQRPVKRSEPKAGRNDPCPCGSGKKFKKCCG